MSLTKTIEIDGKQVQFRASAMTPRLYRIKFNRDIFQDMNAVQKKAGSGNQNEAGNGDQNGSSLDMGTLLTFENLAYIMAKHADPSIPDSPDDWLDTFSMFSIYNILPQLSELWGVNVETMETAKKNAAQLTAR